MKQFPEVARFLSYFDGRARERRPILAIVGETGLGKSLLAGEVLKEVGRRLGKADFLEVTVEDSGALDLSDFDPRAFSGVLLDGVGDALLLKDGNVPSKWNELSYGVSFSS